MEQSYNGWPASPTAKDFGGLDNRVVPGSTVKLAPGVRAGDVAKVLFYVAQQLHARVEKGGEGCWGFAYRQNRNAANLSCHASATAFDWNAPLHPNGKSGTFTKAQVTEIRRILAEVHGAVRWGGDFTGTKDEMHFEIVQAPAAVKTLASSLGAVPAPTPAPTATPAPAPPEEDTMIAVSIAPNVRTLVALPAITVGKALFVRFAVDDPAGGANVRVAVGWGDQKWHALPGLDKVDGFTGWIVNGRSNEAPLGGTDSCLSIEHLGTGLLGVLAELR